MNVKTTEETSFRVSKLKRRLHRHICDYSFINATLLEILCRSSDGVYREIVEPLLSHSFIVTLYVVLVNTGILLFTSFKKNK